MSAHSYPSNSSDSGRNIRVAVTETGQENVPAIPLPPAGEGGPVFGPGGSEESTPPTTVPPTDNNAGTPVIPLPNPGEGGPVFGPTGPGSIGPGFIPNRPGSSGSIPLPPIFRPIFPGGSSVTVIPGISFPCFNCTSSNTLGRVRILNASTGYQPFNVYLGSWLVASQLGNGDLTSYVQAAGGSQTITVSGAGGYVYIQKSITVRSGSSMTVAIINTNSGLDLMEISDASCSAPENTSCLRACNLSLNLGPFNVTLENQNITFNAFSNVRYREVTSYTSLFPGWYQIYISRTGNLTGSSIAATSANLMANTSYTLFMFNAPTAVEGLRAMIVSN